MKNKMYSLPVKMLFIFLFLLSLLGTFAGGAVSLVNVQAGVFGMAPEGVWRETMHRLVQQSNARVIGNYEYEETELTGQVNYRYVIMNEEGERLDGNYENEATQYSLTSEYELWHTRYNEETGDYEETYETVQVTGYVLETLVEEDEYTIARHWSDVWYRMRYVALVLAILCLCIDIILFVLLMCCAGHQNGQEGVRLNRWLDRIPFDLYTIAYIGLLMIPPAIGSSIWGGYVYWKIAVFAMIIVTEGLLFVAYTMSFSARLKVGGLLHGMFFYRSLRWIIRSCKWIIHGIGVLINNIPLLWQAIVLIAAVSFIELFVMAQVWYTDEIIWLWFVEKLILIPVILWIVLMMRRIQQAGKKISQGKLEETVDLKHMRGPFREHAENLNSINSAISKAVDARMKSEHFKTELITNVSHDIKTPLTSIINYVNLIKKEDPQDETLREYIEVLDRQSVRLKKLIEDLVEASKASTGNLPVNMAPCEVGVLLGQAAAEYEDKLKENALDLQLIVPEEPITILADGRHLWRVFDNLLNNICKYSQPQTRVYLNLDKREGKAFITFRNISKYALNISSDELMERFVRGDGSRHTEGSGLGLSIARSLVELQQGTIDLVVDGDLFKVILTFQTV